MFSQIYPSLDLQVRHILRNVKKPTKERVQEILDRSLSQSLALSEIAELLEIGRDEGSVEQFDIIREFLYARFRSENNTLRHIAPVYLSSFCVDTCSYCNFSAKRKDTQRTRLSLVDLEEELRESVLPLGNRVIEFTLATDPHFIPSVLAQYIAKTKELLQDEKGSGVLLCSDFMSIEAYQQLKDIGLWGMVQWDETLDIEKYQKWHGTSPRKKDFGARIDNHDRAIRAGLEVATGILFGLADYRYDVLMQIAKARYQEAEYGRMPFVFGTPRLKPIGGKELHTKEEVNDRQYELALMIYKIAVPQISRWLQTRETPELNLRNIVNQDVYTHQCGNVTPGGYRVNRGINVLISGQFGVNEMTKKQFEKALRQIDFKVDYAWIK